MGFTFHLNFGISFGLNCMTSKVNVQKIHLLVKFKNDESGIRTHAPKDQIPTGGDGYHNILVLSLAP